MFDLPVAFFGIFLCVSVLFFVMFSVGIVFLLDFNYMLSLCSQYLCFFFFSSRINMYHKSSIFAFLTMKVGKN